MTEQRGATAIEYSLIVFLIALAVIVGVGLLAGTVHGLFRTAGNALSAGG